MIDDEDEEARYYRLNIYEPYYLKMLNKYAKNLTTAEIFMGFPEEIKTIVPRVIRRLENELKVDYERASMLKGMALEYFDNEVATKIAEDSMPKAKVTRLQSLKGLKNMLDFGQSGDSKFTPEQIEQARKIDIKTLYQFNKPRTYGNRYTACCPFHKNGQENTPSFMIFPRGNYNCFGCGKKGSGAIDFIMELNGVRFSEAVKFLLKA